MPCRFKTAHSVELNSRFTHNREKKHSRAPKKAGRRGSIRGKTRGNVGLTPDFNGDWLALNQTPFSKRYLANNDATVDLNDGTPNDNSPNLIAIIIMRASLISVGLTPILFGLAWR